MTRSLTLKTTRAALETRYDGSLTWVISNFNIQSISFPSDHSKLIVDPDAMLTHSIAAQSLEAGELAMMVWFLSGDGVLRTQISSIETRTVWYS